MSRHRYGHVVLLDDEAIQALRSSAHPKHRIVLDQVDVGIKRREKAELAAVVVPTAVRVEAGWDRTDPAWALANRLQIVDSGLDASQANVATAMRRRVSGPVTVVDAHVGAVVQSADADRVTVITSDPRDMAAVAEGAPTVIVAS